MRIGVITFWQSKDNYGQLLQCWALQHYLRSCGHEPFLICYEFGNKTSVRRLLIRIYRACLIYPLINQWKRMKKRKLLKLYMTKNEFRKFDDFREKYIIFSDHVYSNLKQLQQNPPSASAYVVGSDQVWNPVLLRSKENNVFWLDFGDSNTRRISYAASFGMDECPKSLKRKLYNQLQRFDAISVREESGISICKECDKIASHVLDPTLLLSAKDYLSLIENKPIKSEPYIFIYSINIANKDELQYDELYNFTEEKRFSIVVTPASGYLPGQELYQGVKYSYATIPEWLTLIKDAELVVTTSFHGIVFCILLHKSFVYIPLRGEFEKGNSRVINLLDKLELSDHIWRRKGDYERISSIDTDWELVEYLLSDLRKVSYDFLEQALM